MSYDINLKLWDERACHVGEGPVAIGRITPKFYGSIFMARKCIAEILKLV